MASLQDNGLRMVVFSNNTNSKYHEKTASAKYLPHYYRLRRSVFSENGRKSLCGDGADQYDDHRDSHTVLLLDSTDKVVGGRKIGIHEPDSGTELTTDRRILNDDNVFMTIPDSLPHLDAEGKRYAFFSGMCFDKTVRGRGYSEEFNKATYDLVKELKCDFSATQLQPGNFIRMTKAALQNGALQVVARTEQRAVVGTFRTYISFQDEQMLPLQTVEQKENGIGMRVTLASLREIGANLKSIFPEHYPY